MSGSGSFFSSSGGGALLGSFSSGAFGLAGMALQQHYYKKNRKWEEEKEKRMLRFQQGIEQENLDYENSINQKNWQLQNEYNSPLAQRARMEEAGLNPAGLAGAGASGNASSIEASSGSVPSASSVSPYVPSNTLGASALEGAQVGMAIAKEMRQAKMEKESHDKQMDLADAQINETNARADSLRGSESRAGSMFEIEKQLKNIELDIKSATSEDEKEIVRQKLREVINTNNNLILESEVLSEKANELAKLAGVHESQARNLDAKTQTENDLRPELLETQRNLNERERNFLSKDGKYAAEVTRLWQEVERGTLENEFIEWANGQKMTFHNTDSYFDNAVTLCKLYLEFQGLQVSREQIEQSAKNSKNSMNSSIISSVLHFALFFLTRK